MYQTAGTWDLGSSLTADGVGGLVADIVVYQIVSAAGVPSALEEDARDAVAELIREPIRARVAAALPAELLPESGLMGDLNAILASVQVTTLLSLFQSPTDANALFGTEVIETMSISRGGSIALLSLPDLLEGSGAIEIAADLAVEVTGPSAVEISRHELQIRLGRLIEMAVEEFALVADLGALSQQAAAAVDCPALLDAITGGADTFDIEVAGQSFSVTLEQLDDACQEVHAQIESQVLGLFRIDTGVIVGGGVGLGDSDADDRVDRLTSDAGYGGELTNLPVPVAVPFSATMSATAL